MHMGREGGGVDLLYDTGPPAPHMPHHELPTWCCQTGFPNLNFMLSLLHDLVDCLRTHHTEKMDHFKY